MNDSTALLENLDTIAAGITRPNLSPRERQSRASVFAEDHRDLATLARAGDPYTTGRHSELADALHVAEAGRRGREPDPAIAERLHVAQQVRLLTAAVQNQTTIDTPGLLPVAVMPFVPGLGAAPLVELATPVAGFPAGPTVIVPGTWTPRAVGGAQAGGEKTSLPTGTSTVDGTVVPIRVSGFTDMVSQQSLDWPVITMREYEQKLIAAADNGLDTMLAADLAATATAAADIPTAIGAASCVGYGPADLVLYNPADWQKVASVFTGLPAQFVPARITGDEHCPAGSVLVAALAAVALYATATATLSVVRPANLTWEVAAVREGIAAPRAAGAVQTVTLTAP